MNQKHKALQMSQVNNWRSTRNFTGIENKMLKYLQMYSKSTLVSLKMHTKLSELNRSEQNRSTVTLKMLPRLH